MPTQTERQVPGHGSRSRYRHGCRCLGCCRNGAAESQRPTALTWPIKFILEHHSEELISDRLRVLDPEGEGDIRHYRKVGLSDDLADKLAIGLHEHPGTVWPGWIEAGLDVHYP